MNSSEEPAYEFVDNDALFVYVTSDIRGGRVCIVSADITDPTGKNCLNSVAWGSPNSIVGIGSVIQPIELANSLAPGSWRLLTTDTDDKATGLSEVFTVTACADCPRTLKDEVTARWKSMARDHQVGAKLYCDVAKLKAAREEAKKHHDLTLSWTEQGVDLITIGYSPGGGFAFSIANPFEVTQQKALEILKDLTCAVSNMYGNIADDPPDPDFRSIVEPAVGTVDELYGPAETDLARSWARQVALADASLTAYERYLGALAADDKSWQAKQLTSTSELTRSLVTETRSTIALLDAFADVAEADPLLSGQLAPDQQQIQDLAAGYERLRTAGLTSAERQSLVNLGLTETKISDLLTNFDNDFDGVEATRSLADYTRELSAQLAAGLDEFDAFGREAAAVGARLALDPSQPNGAPTAVAKATPATGTAPLAVTFDGTGSSDPEGRLAGYAWNFRDGATGSGPSAQHTFAEPGTYSVELLVTDDAGLTGVTNVTVVVTRPGPVLQAAFTTTPPRGIAPMTVSFDARSSIGESISGYAWDFGDGTTGDGPNVSHRYATVGDFAVRLTVTDANGATNTVTSNVSARDPKSLDVPVCGDQDQGNAVIRCASYTRENDVETWLVGGSGRVDVVFDYVYLNAGLLSQLSSFIVDDAVGSIDGIRPGAPGYAARALERARNVFPVGSTPTIADVILQFEAGQRLAFYISASSNDVLAQLDDPTSRMLFSIGAANTDRIGHALAFNAPGLPTQFSFEDVQGGGDGDFDDLVFTASGLNPVDPQNRAPTVANLSSSTVQDTPVAITLSGVDPDDDVLTYSVTTPPVHGTLDPTGSTRTYTPNVGYFESDSFTYTATDGLAVSNSAVVTITITPAATCQETPPTVQSTVSAKFGQASTTFTSAKLSAAAPGLVAVFVEADGPAGSAQRVKSVNGAGLTWKLAVRSSTSWGTAEIWYSFAPTGLKNATVTAKMLAGYDGAMTVVAFAGSAVAPGAIGSGQGTRGAPSVSLTTTGCHSLVFAAGHDWSNAAPITAPAGQSLVHTFVDRRVNDTFWTQRVDSAIPGAGQYVRLVTNGPTKDRWAMAAVEIVAS